MSALPAGVKALGRSLAINALAPYLAYRILEAAFPAPSLVPLTASAAIPAIGLAWEFARRKAADAVAVISLAQLSISLLINLVAHDPRAALAGHALQPLMLGLVFLASALADRPLMIPLARQAMAGDDAERQARFDALSRQPGPRARFRALTLAWAAALSLQTIVQWLALQRLPASAYVLFANLLGYAVLGLLIWGSLRYGRRAGARLQAAGA